jgi:hypothetical protein
MSAIQVEKVPLVGGVPQAGGAIVEINLLLETWLLTALEEAARQQGMTAATLARRLIRDFLYYSDDGLSSPSARLSSLSPVTTKERGDR